ncbi:MAG: hypothetical protein WEE51_11465 [Pirellulaceae bacterium]
MKSQRRIFAILALVQGIYYGPTGLWAIVHIESFKLVTGEKTDNLPSGLDVDHWLVYTVAILIVSIAVGLLVGGARKSVGPELIAMAIVAAVGLMAIDVIYVTRGVIRPIYLLDAVFQGALVLAWIAAIFWVRQDHATS